MPLNSKLALDDRWSHYPPAVRWRTPTLLGSQRSNILKLHNGSLAQFPQCLDPKIRMLRIM